MQLKQLGQETQQQAALAPGQVQQQQQQLQLGQQAIQQGQYAEQDRAAGMKAMQEWSGKDVSELPDLIQKNGGSLQAVLGAKKNVIESQQAVMNLNAAQLAQIATKTNYLLGKLQANTGKDVPDEQLAPNAMKATQEAINDGYLDPQHAQEVQQMVQSYTNPADLRNHLSIYEKGLMSQSEQFAQESKNRQVAAEEAQAAARASQADTAAQRLKDQQPGGPLYKNPDNENTGSWSLQEGPNGTSVLLNSKTGESKPAPTGVVPKGTAVKNEGTVVGIEPSTGKQVQVSQQEAVRLGLTDVNKAQAADVSKAVSARHWLDLAGKPGDPNDSSTMGILPLIDKLDKEGKLGAIASRWNEFMAGKVGVGDPDIEALRAKMGLGTTLLMQAHVGNRGGSFMLEHFEDLASAKKMDAQTLRSGIKSEMDYMRDKAMLPSQGGAQGGGPASQTGAPATSATTRIKASDGSMHNIPTARLADAKKIDPNLQVVQ